MTDPDWLSDQLPRAAPLRLTEIAEICAAGAFVISVIGLAAVLWL